MASLVSANGVAKQPLRTSSDVSVAVHNLLLASTDLRSSLKGWAEGKNDETVVSDVYVSMTHDFNAAMAAFSMWSISSTDIQSFPLSLRNILEAYLGEEPSIQVLEELLPELRQLYTDLYTWLQSKEFEWKRATGQKA